jgi:hypothetical protein
MPNHRVKTPSPRKMLHDVAEELREPAESAATYLKKQVRANPEMAALLCLGVGFVLGWRLKPW